MAVDIVDRYELQRTVYIPVMLTLVLVLAIVLVLVLVGLVLVLVLAGPVLDMSYSLI